MRFTKKSIFLTPILGFALYVSAQNINIPNNFSPTNIVIKPNLSINQERYCDPVENASAFEKIKEHKDKLKALDNVKNQESKKMELIHNIHQFHSELKCNIRKNK